MNRSLLAFKICSKYMEKLYICLHYVEHMLSLTECFFPDIYSEGLITAFNGLFILRLFLITNLDNFQ